MGDKTIIVTFKIPRKMLEDLDYYCYRVGQPRSEIIRRAIYEYLYNHGKDVIRTKEHNTFKVKRIILSG